MKLEEAKPGDILQDRDGAVWLVGRNGARCMYDPTVDTGEDDDAFNFTPATFGHVAKFGPFTRLVPEKETP